MFEQRHERLLTRGEFARRMVRAIAAGFAMVVVSVSLGTIGYRMTEHMGWLDSVYNATMILTGMGPARELKTDAGKIFATIYALFSGLVFLTTGGLVLTPMVHRMLHRFHVEGESQAKSHE